jgi:hypothetical protein
MALVDGRLYWCRWQDEFAYAHPLFWAPYSVIGDGGTIIFWNVSPLEKEEDGSVGL